MTLTTTDALTIEIEQGQHATTLQLPLSQESCWARLLGPWPLPVEGAIDAMNAVFEQGGVTRVTIQACPSAALLPLLWIRTIWCPINTPETGTTCVLRWLDVTDHARVPSRQAAGKLACAIADHVECQDPASAHAIWGIDLENPAPPEEAFDLLTNIIDHWDTDLQRVTLAADWGQAVRRALINCALLGHKRVAIYGAGTHTRAAAEALMEPPLQIVCIIDDDARRHGHRLWGYEIVSRDRALQLELDAVVISANSIEDRLWAQSAPLREQGIMVTRLYG